MMSVVSPSFDNLLETLDTVNLKKNVYENWEDMLSVKDNLFCIVVITQKEIHKSTHLLS